MGPQCTLPEIVPLAGPRDRARAGILLLGRFVPIIEVLETASVAMRRSGDNALMTGSRILLDTDARADRPVRPREPCVSCTWRKATDVMRPEHGRRKGH